jgi:hypothetical protein
VAAGKVSGSASAGVLVNGFLVMAFRVGAVACYVIGAVFAADGGRTAI